MEAFAVIAGVVLVAADYVIKFAAIGVLPGNRKPSSGRSVWHVNARRTTSVLAASPDIGSSWAAPDDEDRVLRDAACASTQEVVPAPRPAQPGETSWLASARSRTDTGRSPAS